MSNSLTQTQIKHWNKWLLIKEHSFCDIAWNDNNFEIKNQLLNETKLNLIWYNWEIPKQLILSSKKTIGWGFDWSCITKTLNDSIKMIPSHWFSYLNEFLLWMQWLNKYRYSGHNWSANLVHSMHSSEAKRRIFFSRFLLSLILCDFSVYCLTFTSILNV